jgi:tetratricopeptide (TPR) repeat protein
MSIELLPNTAQTTQAAGNKWFYSPSLDLIVGCGAWTLPLLLLIYPLVNTLSLSFAFYLLSLLCNYPHYMATIYRAYRTREDFTKYKIFTLHLTVLLLLTAVLLHLSHWAMQLLYTVYITWSSWHYTGQNFGLTLMFVRRNGAKPAKEERNGLYLAFFASFLMVFFRYHTGPSNDPYALSLNLPVWLGPQIWPLLAIAFVALGSWSILRMVRQVGLRPMVAPIVLLTTQFLWFVLPDILNTMGLSQYTQVSYNAGVLALIHCAQYLWITSYYAQREAQASEHGRWRPWVYFGILVVGGIALFVPGPWVVSYIFQYDFSTSFIVFISLINIHHFLLDGAIWKLRDGRIAALLLDLREKATVPVGSVGAAFTGATQWIKGMSLPARTFRIAFITVLLVLAVLDQANHYFSSDANNLPNLLRAETLNPYDSTTQSRIAWAQKKAGNLEQTMIALDQAVALSPRKVELKLALAQLLLQKGRSAEASHHYQEVLTLNLGSIDAKVAGIVWFGFGETLRRSGHPRRVVFACFLKAEELLQSSPDAQLNAVINSRREAEASLGVEASAVRGNLETILAETLALQL